MRNYKKSLISCIVPVYNVEKYLPTCIDSILSQVYQSYEIILVDDGSTDGSGKICDTYIQKSDRIVVIHQNNGGVSDARNRGVQSAKGEFITFIDSDDVVHPLFLNDMMQNLTEHQADICIAENLMFPDETKYIFTDQYNLEQELSRKIMLLSPVQALNEMFSGTIEMTAWGKLYKTELFKDIRYPKDTMYEDWATIYKLIGKADRIVSTHKKLYGYRIRKGSLTQTGLRPGMLVIFNICDEINEYLQKQYPECLEAFAYRRAQASMMMMDRIIAGKSSAEHYDMLKQCKQRVRVDLKPVLFNSKVKLLYKVSASLAAYNILLYKFVISAFYKYKKIG